MAFTTVDKMVDMLIKGNAHSVTHFTEAKGATAPRPAVTITRVTRKLLHGRVPNPKHGYDVVLTVGAPNFLEREYVKRQRKLGQAVDNAIRIKNPAVRRKPEPVKRRKAKR